MDLDTRANEIATLLARLTTLMAEQPRPEAPNHPQAVPGRVLLTVKEAAAQLGIGPTKAYELIKAGELESVQIGRLRRVHVDAIRAYAARLIDQQANGRSAA